LGGRLCWPLIEPLQAAETLVHKQRLIFSFYAVVVATSSLGADVAVSSRGMVASCSPLAADASVNVIAYEDSDEEALLKRRQEMVDWAMERWGLPLSNKAV
jgi:hypothetical protein